MVAPDQGIELSDGYTASYGTQRCPPLKGGDKTCVLRLRYSLAQVRPPVVINR